MGCYTGFAVLLLFFFAEFQGSLSITCVKVKNPKLRFFSSLLEFQANKKPFDPSESKDGNYVMFTFQSLENLNKNAFVTYDSDHIMKIFLNEKSIKKIEDGAFLSLTCLASLELMNNSITELTWRTFEGMPNLQILRLGGNKLKELPAMVFENNLNMMDLDVSYNKLKNLSPFSFANLTELQTLNLRRNLLIYITPEVFSPLTKLESLDLSGNKLIDLDAHKWPLPNLKYLILSENFLRSFDTTLNYTFRTLKELDLSYNRLTQLNSFALKKTFHSLSVLDLNGNYWRCEDLSNILHYLADAKLEIPGNNKTNINEKGIDCENVKTKLPFDFETSTEISSSSKLSNNSGNIDMSGKYEARMDNIVNKSDEILLEISGIRKLFVFSLFFFVLCVILYAIIQLGLFDVLKRKVNIGNSYTQPVNQDTYASLM